MRILILGMNYLPESASIGPYTADLAEYLQKRGHQVRVVTSFPMAPQWRIWESYRGEWFRREIVNGILVTRTFIFVPREPRRAINRVLYDMSFSLSAIIGALLSGPCDAILAISPPLQIGVAGWLISKIRRVPFFFHIQDLVPDAAVATGLLTEKSTAVKIARDLENYIYRRVHSISVICDGFRRNLLSKQVPSSKIRLMPNYIDLEFMRSFPRANPFRTAHGFDEKDFLVMYSGSIALKQGLTVLVDAAAILKNEKDIKLVIIGEGPPLADLKSRANELGLSNLFFLPFQPRESLPQQLR